MFFLNVQADTIQETIRTFANDRLIVPHQNDFAISGFRSRRGDSSIAIDIGFDPGVDFTVHDDDIRSFQVFGILLEFSEGRNFDNFSARSACRSPA